MADGTWVDDGILVTLYDEAGVAGEQFRKLQARLRALKHALGGNLVTIVVTSPLMGEGKTACATNLAIALAHEPGRRVLLTDCDVRKPKIQGFLNERAGAGLLDVLEGGTTIEEAVVRMPGGNLDILPLAGPRWSNGNRPHALPIEKVKDVLSGVKDRYEFIVCDAPPLLPTADAGALVDICDSALMVVRAGVTPRPAAAQALAGINKNKLVGFLLNGVPTEKMRGYYYYRYYGSSSDSKGKS